MTANGGYFFFNFRLYILNSQVLLYAGFYCTQSTPYQFRFPPPPPPYKRKKISSKKRFSSNVWPGYRIYFSGDAVCTYNQMESSATWNKSARAYFSKTVLLSLKTKTCADLFQIALDSIWLFVNRTVKYTIYIISQDISDHCRHEAARTLLDFLMKFHIMHQRKGIWIYCAISVQNAKQRRLNFQRVYKTLGKNTAKKLLILHKEQSEHDFNFSTRFNFLPSDFTFLHCDFSANQNKDILCSVWLVLQPRLWLTCIPGNVLQGGKHYHAV